MKAIAIIALTLPLLAGCLAATPSAADRSASSSGLAAGLSFLGTWDCEVETFTFTADSYRPGAHAPALRYVQVERYGDDTFGLTFPNDYRIGLMGVTRNTMTWSSPQSGDIFECARLS